MKITPREKGDTQTFLVFRRAFLPRDEPEGLLSGWLHEVYTVVVDDFKEQLPTS